MEERYWQELNAAIFFILISIVVIIVLTVLKVKRVTKLSNNSMFCVVLLLIMILLFSMKEMYVLAQDYSMVINGEYEEEDMLLVDYLNIHEDLDGNGQTSYTKPKFYIESKDEYIVLYLTDLEIGKTYRIRYYPNSKIAEVLYCVDEVTEETQ